MSALHPLWTDAETAVVQVAMSQWMPEEGQEGTEEHFPGAVLNRVCLGIALLIGRVGKVIVVVWQQMYIPLLADSAVAFVVVRFFVALVIGAVAEIFANVAAIAVVAVLAVVFVSAVAFVLTAAGSGSNAVLAVVAVLVAIAQVVATVVDVAVFVVGGVGVVLDVVFAAEFAVYGALVSGFAAAAAAEVAAAVAAAGDAAEFDFGNLFGCCLQNSHFARFCYRGIPDNTLLPSFAWVARKLTERAEALMCSQW